MTIHFYLRFSTKFGQTICISGNNDVLGNDDLLKALPIQYFNNEFWHGSIEIDPVTEPNNLRYKYILREEDREETVEFGDDRILELDKLDADELACFDTWNYSGETENVYFTQPFQDVLLKTTAAKPVNKLPKNFTHEFRVKAPILHEDEVVCLLGGTESLNNWSTDKPLLMAKNKTWWKARLNLGKETFPVAYKYGIYNTKTKQFVAFENGNNRMLNGDAAKKKITIQHDGFINLTYTPWKGAGVAIPVFSLRSKNSFGAGEFTDIKLLVDWAKQVGLKLIQVLPLNDTTATHTWKDSYPYAAISAFALHPLFLNLEKAAGAAAASVIKPLKKKQQQLNALADMDYDSVIKFKLSAIKEIFAIRKEDFINDTAYFEFFELNRHWLVPYAAFCYLRDKYNTSDFNSWKTHSEYDENAIQRLVSPTQKHYDEIAVHYFTQYHLHVQLKEATAYAHKNGIVVKGDIPIGIYRNSVDAWMAPSLYNMNAQAGAPPDDFAVKGQNWGFPTYNWRAMQQDHFTWWRQRFEQMSNYFDAFRIDHILGFFRIWSIPLHAVEGIMGRFDPAIPLHINELFERNISYDWHRYCRPYITDAVLHQEFGDNVAFVKEHFLTEDNQLKEAYNTQRKVADHFAALNDEENPMKFGLFNLISNVILFEQEGSQGQQFHFRIAMEDTSSFRNLDHHSQQALKELQVNYFFRRQDDFWEQEAMQKLPGLKRSTNMLICGEDLGMVPHCVPDVMKRLGILSLEIQRMPKKENAAFFHPNDAPYMSVVTPSTHDMSTIRGWWQEDREKTQRFYNTIMGRYGEAPYFCEPWVNKEIVLEHLYSPAMWSIFQLQDMLGISETIRRQNPEEERINVPANPNHYWRYRMHLTLEDLLKADAFNEELKGYVQGSGR
ncbi:MAG: 4-alpha-glucanotransferase [Bacteroidetes bacterium]|nr:4-alpha-glucanotransferase [Bacteroidota bacterium]